MLTAPHATHKVLSYTFISDAHSAHVVAAVRGGARSLTTQCALYYAYVVVTR